MSVQLSMFDPPSCAPTPSAISSLESADGPTHSISLDGLMIGASGPAQVPVNLSPRQAKAMGLLTSGTSGRLGSTSSASASLMSSSASRLRRVLGSDGWILFTLTWKARVTPAGRSISALRASRARTSGSVCSLDGNWATPKASNGGANSNRDQRGNVGADLQEQVALVLAWPTPRAEDAESTGAHRGTPDTLTSASALAAPLPTPCANDDNKTPEAHLAMKLRMGERDGSHSNRTAITSLQVMAQTVVSPWATPNTRDWKSESTTPEFFQERFQHPRGKSLSAEATLVASAWPTPTGQDAVASGVMNYPATETHHAGVTLTDAARMASWISPQAADANGCGQNQNTASLDKQVRGTNLSGSTAKTGSGGQLNPDFSRWLMGYPSAWGSCAVTAMRSIRGLRKRSSKRLLTPKS